MTKLHRIAAQLCAAALLTTAVAVVASAPTATAATAATAASGASDITVYLTPPDPAGLQALADAHGLSHEQRVARLQQLLPDPAPVAAGLASLGLTVTSEDGWSVSAHAPASTIANLFGTRPTIADLATATTAEIRAAAGSLPLLPSVLHGLVSAVIPAGGPATLRSHATGAGVTYNGDQIRSAYNQPFDGTGSNPTIATIQFSGDPSLVSDLATYASQNHITNAGALQSVTVGSGPADSNDATEVSLDQEAILAVSPALTQRVYFASNDNAGFVAAYNQVLQDVLHGSHDIVALSSSWGQCESQTPSSVMTATESILTSLVAAGVTVFGASGDNGIYDCGAPTSALCPLACPAATVDVDYPASSPSVVGVGGTTLTQSGGAWQEDAWSCTTGMVTLFNTNPDCYAHGGTGGGASGMATSTDADGFAMPAYQKNNIVGTAYNTNAKRLVPDVSALGDPSTGLNAVVAGSNVALGGTSLATPVSAALFAGTLSHYGVNAGIGDVHPTIYSMTRYADAQYYARDVTHGTNGANSDKGNDPSVSAAQSYDTLTGVGSVYWSSLAPFLLPAMPTLSNVTLTSKGTTVTATWNVSKAPNGAALTPVTASITGPNGSTILQKTDAAPNAVVTFTGVPGGHYSLFVSDQDLLGHRVTKNIGYTVPADAVGGPAAITSGPGTLTIDDVNFKGSGWKRVRTHGAFGGKILKTSARGRKVSVKVTAQTITLTFFAGPANGRLTVIVDGKKIVVDEYSKRAVRKSITLLAGKTAGVHTVQLVSTGARNPHSRGTTVDVDFLTAYLA